MSWRLMRSLPGAAQDAQYTKFTTERPTFAELEEHIKKSKSK